MNWFKQNKFLATWLVVTLLGAGALAFLMLSAQSTYAEAQQRYDEQSSELSRLQTAAPFPNAENLKKMEALRKDHQAAITTLQKDLAAAQIPLVPLTPEGFQDLLDKTVKRVTARAKELNVELPSEKFYLGFDKYERDIPRAEAASKLGRQLKAMEFVVTQLLEKGVTKLTDLKRDPLPEEGTAPAAGASSSGPGTSGKANRNESESESVGRRSFDIAFIAQEAKFHSFVNAIVTSKTQFLIPKSVIVKNEREQGPSRVDLAAAPPPPPPPTPPAGVISDPPPTPPKDATPPPAPRKYIVGDEKLQVVMKIEIVEFPAAASVATK